MRILKYAAVAGLAVVLSGAVAGTAKAAVHIQVGIGIGAPVYVGPPPDCAYGYYPYSPYQCAPYGYYGSEWFVNGIFIGAGPWFRGFYGPAFYGGRGFDDPAWIYFHDHDGWRYFRGGDRWRDYHGDDGRRGYGFRGREYRDGGRQFQGREGFREGNRREFRGGRDTYRGNNFRGREDFHGQRGFRGGEHSFHGNGRFHGRADRGHGGRSHGDHGHGRGR